VSKKQQSKNIENATNKEHRGDPKEQKEINITETENLLSLYHFKKQLS